MRMKTGKRHVDDPCHCTLSLLIDAQWFEPFTSMSSSTNPLRDPTLQSVWFAIDAMGIGKRQLMRLLRCSDDEALQHALEGATYSNVLLQETHRVGYTCLQEEHGWPLDAAACSTLVTLLKGFRGISFHQRHAAELAELADERRRHVARMEAETEE
jgi:hypothetical protein